MLALFTVPTEAMEIILSYLKFAPKTRTSIQHQRTCRFSSSSFVLDAHLYKIVSLILDVANLIEVILSVFGVKSDVVSRSSQKKKKNGASSMAHLVCDVNLLWASLVELGIILI